MVIVACKCLNITANISDDNVSSSSSSGKPFRGDGPGTATIEFLKESIGPFTDPAQLRFETKHDELTTCRRFQVTPHAGTATQLWSLTTCIICDQPVYATRVAAPRKSISSENVDDFAVVFNGKLLATLEAINALKADEHYSKIYKVIIRQPSSSIFSMLSATSSSPPRTPDAGLAIDLLNNNSNPRLKNLISLLNERLRKETEATEERIRQYTADQFVALRLFRQAAEVEFVHLAQKIQAEPAAQPPNELFPEGDKKLISISIVGGNLLETPPLTPDSGTMTMNNSPPRLLLTSHSARSLAPIINASSATAASVSITSPMASRLSALRKRNSDSGNVPGNGAEDEDDLFDMEGFFPGGGGNYNAMDQQQPMSDCSEEFDEDEEEDDDEDERSNGRRSSRHATGRHIPMRDGDYSGGEHGEQLSGGMVIAKSLPIPTPAMLDRIAQQECDERLEDNVDIAASIKALAKSVHGSDAIFGDLPRPRLRTKI